MLKVIEQMLDESKSQDILKEDYDTPSVDLSFSPPGNLNIPWNGVTLNSEITDYALRQMFIKLGKVVFPHDNSGLPPKYFLRIKHSDPELFSQLMNWHMADSKDEWMIRTYDSKVRAVLSSGYAKVHNTDMLDAMRLLVIDQNPQNGEVYDSSVTPDELHLRTLWADTGVPDGAGGYYKVGAYLGNGEIGNSYVRVHAMVQRTTCKNSLMTLENALTLRHFGDVHSIMMDIKKSFINIFPTATKLVNQMVRAEGRLLPNFIDVLDNLAKKHNWSPTQKSEVGFGMEGKNTVAGLVNGITYAAHTLELDEKERVVWENFGGKLLVTPDSVFARMQPVEVE